MAQQLQLEVVTPERRVLSEAVDMTTVPGLNGELGILPGHTPLISQLKTGVLSYTKDGKVFQLHVSGGFIEVRDDHVAVLAEIAERPEEIDAAQARSARERVEKQLSGWTGTEEEMEKASVDLERAQVRLQLATGKPSSLKARSCLAPFRILPSAIAFRISRTAPSRPTKIERDTMLWPMLNSVISGIAATAPTLR